MFATAIAQAPSVPVVIVSQTTVAEGVAAFKDSVGTTSQTSACAPLTKNATIAQRSAPDKV